MDADKLKDVQSENAVDKEQNWGVSKEKTEKIVEDIMRDYAEAFKMLAE